MSWAHAISYQSPSGPQTLFLIPRPVDPDSLSCKCPSTPKPYFLYHVPSTQLRSHACTLQSTNLIFHTNFSSACHVPLTQLHSHASTLWPINLIFHTIFSNAYHIPLTQLHSHASILRPINLIFHTNFSIACHVPSTQVCSHASVH